MSTPIGQMTQPPAAMAGPAMDDDDTIREVLQTISAAPPAPSGAPLMSGGQDAMLLPPQAHMPQQRAEPHYPTSAYIPTLAAELPSQARAAFVTNPTSTIDRYWDSDAQKACTVAAIAALVLALPVEKVVFQYVNVEHVPYSGILVKAACIAAAFYVLSKLESRV